MKEKQIEGLLWKIKGFGMEIKKKVEKKEEEKRLLEPNWRSVDHTCRLGMEV